MLIGDGNVDIGVWLDRVNMFPLQVFMQALVNNIITFKMLYFEGP